MPAHLARLRSPKALDDRLRFLLDEQGRKGRLTPSEKKEAEGRAEMASVLSILKLGAQVKAAKSQGGCCSRQTSRAGCGTRRLLAKGGLSRTDRVRKCYGANLRRVAISPAPFLTIEEVRAQILATFPRD